ncbi:hypothetical protein [Ferrimicrobium sp.]|uniref:hypothetical protein n=1 Tax=Ferrimicrobium sp. TaxID=2926050 RepID=UPI00260DEC1B|nr:hypothetical protein [Ferrimicrobium sp.]
MNVRQFLKLTLSLGAGSLVLAACGGTSSATSSYRTRHPLAANYATVLESPSGNLYTEAQAYQHGQVLEAKDGVLRLMTPEGVSTRGGVSLALTPGGATSWAAVMAQLELYVSPIYVGPIDHWNAAELPTAVAPFPGSVLPVDAKSAVAIVGSKSHGASHQELVRISATGSVTQMLATNPTLEHLAATAHCSTPTYESLTGSFSDPVLLAMCGSGSEVALVSPLAGDAFADRAPKGFRYLGVSALSELAGTSEEVAAAVVRPVGDGTDQVELVGLGAGTSMAKLHGRPIQSPSFAVSASDEWVLVPLAGGKSQVIEFSRTGSVLADLVGPNEGQGIGVSNGGHALVVAANPNDTTITLWRDGTSGFVKSGSLSVPEGVNG